MRITASFFDQDATLKIAKNLLGKVLIFNGVDGCISGIINETEAYSEAEESCHAFAGRKTKRNEVMFNSAGHLYVYFTYGMYYCINVVCGDKNQAEAVLIRSIIPLKGKEIMLKNRNGNTKHLCDGPAKLAIAYGFNKTHNGINLLDKEASIYLEDMKFLPLEIKQTTRIGISKATDLPWRFFCKAFHNK